MKDIDLIGEVDLDKSTIEIDKESMDVGQLKKTIKSHIESGDYDVTLYATALKKLEKTLKTLEEVQLRLPVNVLTEYRKLAKSNSISIESCLRKGVTEYLQHNNKLQSLMEDEDDEEDMPKKGSGKKGRRK
jgi:hypothetical protein